MNPDAEIALTELPPIRYNCPHDSQDSLDYNEVRVLHSGCRHAVRLARQRTLRVDANLRSCDIMESLLRHFAVAIHDVSPRFDREINVILKTIQPLLGKNMSAAIVPRWHEDCLRDAEVAWFQKHALFFNELLLHGYKHYRSSGGKLVSWLTRRSDEFGALSSEEVCRSIQAAQADAISFFGFPLRGLVPPAWTLKSRIDELPATGISFIHRFFSLECKDRRAVPTTTWSWDWGWAPGAGSVATKLAELRYRWHPSSVPVIAIHPADVRSNSLRFAKLAIQKFLERRYEVIRFEAISELVER